MNRFIEFLKNGGRTISIIAVIIFSAGILVSKVSSLQASQELYTAKVDVVIERLATIEERSQTNQEQIAFNQKLIIENLLGD